MALNGRPPEVLLSEQIKGVLTGSSFSDKHPPYAQGFGYQTGESRRESLAVGSTSHWQWLRRVYKLLPLQ